jgi:hypothetical protein
MERFREHEKEFKLKPFSKKAIASAAKDGSGLSYDEYGDEDDNDLGDDIEDYMDSDYNNL